MEQEIIDYIKNNKKNCYFYLRKQNEYVDYLSLFFAINIKNIKPEYYKSCIYINNIIISFGFNDVFINIEKYNIRDILRLFDISIRDVDTNLLSSNLGLKRVKQVYDSLNLEFM